MEYYKVAIILKPCFSTFMEKKEIANDSDLRLILLFLCSLGIQGSKPEASVTYQLSRLFSEFSSTC